VQDEHPDHCVVIKYVPYVGDSKRDMDEYVSEIFMGGTNTIIMHNTCEVRERDTGGVGGWESGWVCIVCMYVDSESGRKRRGVWGMGTKGAKRARARMGAQDSHSVCVCVCVCVCVYGTRTYEHARTHAQHTCMNIYLYM
jgi:hypothetical protein